MASKKGMPAAKEFLDKMFSASDLLEELSEPDLTVQDILAAAKKQGYSFTQKELRDAIATKVNDPGVQIVRFCFSESPSA